jgi:HEAT repeat protein
VVDLDKPTSRKCCFSEEMIGECLLVIEQGDIEDLFDIIPRIGVLRDQRFKAPLIRLLFQKDVKRREFAAYSMGAMRDREFLEPLKKAFVETRELKGFGAAELQVAVIEAIGCLGDDTASDFFLPILQEADASKGSARRMAKWIVESLGSIAQQGGERSLAALLELTGHKDPEVQAQALSELSVAYWHRPNSVADSTLERIYELTKSRNALVAESALAALQSLADVGCRRAESLFAAPQDDET